MSRKEQSRAVVRTLISLAAIIVIVLIVGFLFAGTLWLVSILEPIAEVLSGIGLLLLLPMLAVAAVFRKSRGFCGKGTVFISYLWWIALWMAATLVLYQFWGVAGFVVGVVLLGVGTVPLACLASFFHGKVALSCGMILATALTFLVRTLGSWIVAHGESATIDESEGLAVRMDLKTAQNTLSPWLHTVQTNGELPPWTVGKAFSDEREVVAISPAGQICTPVGARDLIANPELGDAIELRDVRDPRLTTFTHLRGTESFISYTLWCASVPRRGTVGSA